ncbi:uncharacterized protein LOC123204278 isoform X4 [Mangifera indica]|uniref:uncharacterized protein LOC123204278 isoform X4 n=1 Tax=Mangifera indica TaxID=29780 RepID=UPI001CFBB80D|nr:uncharacterized protein LOC123204278 isoform X4 [Mangifera indica]
MLCSGNKSLYTLAKMRLNWELKNCCHHDQVVFPVTVSVCAVVILVLRRTVLLRPFKLVTLFLQEASHAIACRLTCGEHAGGRDPGSS